MGGQGSGGFNRTSDADKKKNGTFKPSRSAAVYAARDAARVIRGPRLSEIPEPDFPLNDVGKKMYDEYAGELFKQKKLTKGLAMRTSLLAYVHQKIYHVMEQGKYPSAKDFGTFLGALREIDIALRSPVTARSF